jgi:type II secretory pathway component PulJ
LADCEKLGRQREELEGENHQLEEYHYILMADKEIVTCKERLEQKNQELQQTISHLQADCEQYQQRLQEQHNHEANLRRIDIVSPCHHQGGQQADLFHVELDLNFNRVIDALEFAEYLFPDILDKCSEPCGIGILPVPAKQARRLPYKTCGNFD